MRQAVSERDIQTAAEHSWRSVEGFPAYEVSDAGLVRNIETGLTLKPEAGHRGHLRVTLYNNDGPQRHLIHRLVLKHFVGQAPEGRDDCAHWDGDPANNYVSNLRWATPRENAEDARRHGRLIVGERSAFAKLNAVEIVEIRNRAMQGASTRQLSNEFGLDISAINRIVTGEAWAHMGGPIREKEARRPLDENAAAEAVKAVSKGLSVNRAAKETGVSRQSIRRRLGGYPSEKLIHAAVVQHWRLFGLPGTLVATLANEYAHGQPGLTRGLFDLLVVAPKLGVGFLELKTERGRLSADQEAFKIALIRANVPYAVTVGRDQPIAVLEQWGVLKRAAA